MKKKILLVLLYLCFVLTLGGCGKKTVLTTEQFKNVTEQRQMTTADVSSQYSSYEYVKEATVATNGNYQIEFYVLDNEENAGKMFDINYNSFESYKGTTSAYSEYNLSNYHTYSLATNGKYYYIARVDNTLLYVNAEDEYKEEIKTIVKNLGY